MGTMLLIWVKATITTQSLTGQDGGSRRQSKVVQTFTWASKLDERLPFAIRCQSIHRTLMQKEYMHGKPAFTPLKWSSVHVCVVALLGVRLAVERRQRSFSSTLKIRICCLVFPDMVRDRLFVANLAMAIRPRDVTWHGKIRLPPGANRASSNPPENRIQQF
jgi:hypothetical protein